MPNFAKITRLPPHIAERIAAGEMIERPSSVVKELIENSLDAGSTEIRVVLEDGGKTLIEVTDNGSGMPPEDLAIAVERHATSKLRSLDDLERISTLGFRGEALHSIAAVSDLTLITRTKESPSAYRFSLGDLALRAASAPQVERVTHGQFIDAPHGTQIRALGLFSQVPARLKFLKSQGAEVTQVREWMERLALAYPHVGFQLVSNDRTLFNLRPQSEEERIKSVLSDGMDSRVLKASLEHDSFQDLGLQARVYWIQGSSSPNSRKLIQIVNSRAIKDKMLQQAVMAPFRQALMPGQFPALVLFLDVNPAAIDVNVHPTKTEVRFLDNRKIFQTVEKLVKSLISQNGATAIPSLFDRSELGGFSNSPEYKKYPEYKEESKSWSTRNWNTPSWDAPKNAPIWNAKEELPPWEKEEGPASARQETAISEYRTDEPSLPPPAPNLNQGAQNTSLLHSALYQGTLFNTYIVYEKGSELVLIDQHAAHERIRYESLRKRLLNKGTESLPSQTLLIPEVVKFDSEYTPSIAEWFPTLVRLGFEAELFGEDSVIFRGVPAEWGTRQLQIRLKNLVERLANLDSPGEPAEGSSVLMDETLFEALASEACHSAIRAGDALEREEIEALTQQLFLTEHPWNCPHGRPTIVQVPERKLEEWFQRKV